MNNREIENNIRNAYLKIQPNQLESILSDCEQKERRYVLVEENRNENRWIPKLAMMAIAFVLAIGLFGYNQMAKINEVVAATISLDVNPSIEIKINKNEKVLDVVALNDDAKLIIGDMDFKGSDLKVTVNALIGSLVRNGYINELTNSILISVDDTDDVQAKSLEEKLMSEISELLSNGSVLSQQVVLSDEVKNIAEKYGITLGKAQMIKELADKTTMYNYEDLAGLTINELNLLSKKLEESGINRNGQPSDKAYIGTEEAKQIALNDLGVSEANVLLKKAELDYENKKMVYEIEFINNNVEYEYVIDALSGEIIYVDREYERNTSSNSNPVSNTPINNAGLQNLVGEDKAKQIALTNAGVSASDITSYRIKREYDDGIVKYEIDFHVGNIEYEYEINATTGDIIKSERDYEDDYRPTSSSKPGVYNYSGSTYKVENGVVYEYDDGRWEVEHDKKVENGIIYEYDDGRWEPDKKVENGKTYEYDDGRWELDDDDDDHDDHDYDDYDDDDYDDDDD